MKAATERITMQALKQFVGGRLKEDELIAQRAIDGHEPGFVWGRDDTADARQSARWNPWRVLGTCVGKRLMLSAHQNVGPGLAHRPGEEDVYLTHTCSTCGSTQDAVAWPCNTLKILALDWVEHVDYQSQWRPTRRDCA
jgi:hypothetical protein